MTDLKQFAKSSQKAPDKMEELLKPHKTFRDPVHGDIKLTRLEVKIVDTPIFQRLRRIRQLGTAHLVYHGARHARFDHALGTVYMAQKIIDAINDSPFCRTKIDPPRKLLTRLCALLHDLPHVPFGHTIDDEGNLFPTQWKDLSRVEYFLGAESEISKIIVNMAGKECYNDVKATLCALTEKDIQKLKYPYVADIVGNTICADLLDYLKRDIYHTGLKEAYDPRFIDYFLVEGENRLVLRMFKERGVDTGIATGKQIRRDIISEILHLLRLRYSLAEKVYYHHTKMSTSAMVIAAVYAMIKEGTLTKEMCDMGDEELLLKLEREGPEVSKYIAERLRKRRVYKPVYTVAYTPKAMGRKTPEEIGRLAKKYRDPKCRYETERQLEDWSDLPKGSVIVYCPKQEMELKVAQMKVLWQDDCIYPLEEVPDEQTKEQIKTIQDEHRALWKMLVYIDQDFYDKEGANTVAYDCTSIFGLSNEEEKFREVQRADAITRRIGGFAIRWSEKYPERPVTVPEMEGLKAGAETREKWTRGKTLPAYDELERLLDDIRT